MEPSPPQPFPPRLCIIRQLGRSYTFPSENLFAVATAAKARGVRGIMAKTILLAKMLQIPSKHHLAKSAQRVYFLRSDCVYFKLG